MNTKRGKKIGRIACMAVGGVILAVLFAFAFGLVVQYLWNYLMPGLFGLKEITYWQAFAMVILAKLLFGAIGSHHGSHGHERYSRKEMKFINGHDTDHISTVGDHARLYGDFWREEGKKAFEEYVKRINADGQVNKG